MEGFLVVTSHGPCAAGDVFWALQKGKLMERDGGTRGSFVGIILLFVMVCLKQGFM